ncbi:hypothetical protein [Novosphingobium sp. MMS21-SN21R]|uniref:hypothetical protein n=1 Tax=Novosphingobium sp. MMS21-SN21R TaxID=2969298 RepID=UPI002883625D|nr:hypothetical protein [Novosphingobium sp. MMS21-SN21R]MDT0507058.1 hypothetical protein [Novosphingobium sp. MMS21-SN21R]
MNAIAHIRRETMVSFVINAVLSGLFFVLVFGTAANVPLWGVGGYVYDYGPQGFVIGMMATLVPGVMARKALRKQNFTGGDGEASRPGVLPRGLIARGLVCGLAGAIGGVVLAAAVLAAIGAAVLAWWPAILAKMAFGAALAIVVTLAGLRIELMPR